MTTNNDTPQMFGDGARRDPVSDPDWHHRADDGAWADDGARADDAARADDGAWTGAGVPEGPNGPAEVDEAHEADEADQPRPPGPHPFSSAYPESPSAAPESLGYPDRFGYPQAPEYPRGPGYAPVPHDLDLEDRGYPAGPGYSDHPQDLQYPQNTWDGLASGSAPGLSYGRGLGYAQDADAVPPMESLPEAPGLPGPAQPGPGGRLPRRGGTAQPGQAGPGMLPPAGTAGRVPRQRMSPGLAPQAPAGADYDRETSDSLTAEALLHGRQPAHGSGWRHGISRLTGGLLRFGESPAERRRRDLINRVRTPVAGGHHRVAVLSLKGGVGKTTTAVGLGATFATLRGDRVIAVDANPDRGTLSDKVRLETAATIRDLLNERDQIRRYGDVRAFTSQAPSRLEVLASDRDPGVSVAFGADDYHDAARILEHFYSICLTDCGTGLLHSAMSGVLRLADQIVVVSSPSVDGARSASATLDWLEAHNCGDLLRNGVVVLSAIRPKSKSTVDLDRLEHHFASRCRAVVRIPYDPHLEEGAEVELELLSAATADAYLALAAIVGDGLAWPRTLTYSSVFP